MISTVFEFLKKNWQLVLLIVVLGVAHFRYARMRQSLLNTIEINQNELSKMKTLYEQSVKEREDAEHRYQSEMNGLQLNYNFKMKQLLQQRTHEIQTMAEKLKDPTLTIKILTDKYGLQYLEGQ